MASGFPGRDLVGYGFGPGSALRVPLPARSEASGGPTGGLLKRPLTEMERLQQQQQQQQIQLQQQLFLRSVKQRTFSPIPPRPSDFSFAAPPPAPAPEMKNQLEELERRLFLDDDDDASASAASLSALTSSNSEWTSAVRQLLTQPQRSPSPLSPSLASSPPSTSSTVSSTASCSPPSTAAPPPRQILLDAAAAIADGNVEAATAHLAALKRSANHRGDAEQRVTAMMVSALLSRLNPPPQIGSANHPISELRSSDHFHSIQMLYELSLPFKLGLIAASYAILDATKDRPKIHILDFEVGKGGHYAAFLRALADRHRRLSSSPPALKITAVADPTSPYTNTNAADLRAVGDRIEKVASELGIALQFVVVYKRAAELDAASLGCDDAGEALAVNLPFVLSRVADESVSPANPRDELLRRVRALRPAIVALVEQEINTNTAAFTGRFTEASAHYGALLESLDSPATRDNPARAQVEAGLVRKAVNSISREGPDRVERSEVFGKWRARMSMAGFQPQPLVPDVIEPVKARFGSFPNQGFTVKEQIGGVGLGFGWMGRVLTVASAWR